MNCKRCLPLVLWLLAFDVAALSSDKDKPMTIEADAAVIDNAKGLTTYSGNVDVRQGTLHVKGDTLVIEKIDDKVKFISVTGAPATYKQRPDNDEQDVTAKAGKLLFYPLKDLIKLEGNAVVTQKDNVYKGHIIEYDNKRNTVKMQGGAAEEPKKRVRMTIQPDKK